MRQFVVLLLFLVLVAATADLLAVLTPAQILLNTTSNEALFTPTFSGSIRHAFSYTNQSSGNMHVILSTLDSSLYLVTYQAGSAPSVRNIFDSTDTQFLLGSFVFYETAQVIIGLDMNTDTLVIFDIEDGFLGNLFVEGVDESSFVALDTDRLFVSSSLQNTIYEFSIISTSQSLNRITLTQRKVITVDSPIALDHYNHRCFVLTNNNQIVMFDDSWNMNATFHVPSGARAVVYLPAINMLLLPDPDCGAIYTVNVNTYEVSNLSGIGLQHSPYEYVLSPYYIARSPWNASDVIVCDHVPLLLENATRLRTLLDYGTSLGCKITDSALFLSTVVVSCGKRILKLVRDTVPRMVALPFIGIENPDAVVSIDSNADDLYAVIRHRTLCVSATSGPPTYSLNRYSSITGTWTAIYRTEATIVSVAAAASGAVFVAEYPRSIKCLNPDDGTILYANTLDSFFVSGIALLTDQITTMCAISKAGNLIALLNTTLSVISSTSVSSPEFLISSNIIDAPSCTMVSAGVTVLEYDGGLNEVYTASTPEWYNIGPVVRLTTTTTSALPKTLASDQPPWGLGPFVPFIIPVETTSPVSTTTPPPVVITTTTPIVVVTTASPTTAANNFTDEPNVTYPFYEPSADKGWSDSPSYWWIVIPLCFTAMVALCVAFVLITGVVRRRKRAAKQPYVPFNEDRSRRNKTSFWCCFPYTKRANEATTIELTELGEVENNRVTKEPPILVKEQPAQITTANGYDPDHSIDLQDVKL